MTYYYNYLILPYRIVGEENDELQMLYSADGTLVQRKYLKNSAQISKKDYLGTKEYQNGILESIYHSEGRIIKNGSSLKYEYHIKDNIGNIRVAFIDDNNDGLINGAERKSLHDYYAYGMEWNGVWKKSENIGATPFRYGGKEMVIDMNLQTLNFHARMMDPVLGRFTSPDPLSGVAPGWTGYRYGFNNPMKYTDPDGMFENNEAASAYAKSQGIKTGWFREHKIAKQSDGTFAIENKKEHTFISDLGEGVGILKGSMVAADDVMNNEMIYSNTSFLGLEGTMSEGYSSTFRDGSKQFFSINAGTIDIGPARGIKALQALPQLDATRKLHGLVPKLKDLYKYPKEQLKTLLDDLRISIPNRIKSTTRKGPSSTRQQNRSHGQRQGWEQDVLQYLEKYLGK